MHDLIPHERRVAHVQGAVDPNFPSAFWKSFETSVQGIEVNVEELLAFAIREWQIQGGKPISVEIGKKMGDFGENKGHDWMFLDTLRNWRSAVCPVEQRIGQHHCECVMYELCMYYLHTKVCYVLVINGLCTLTLGAEDPDTK